MDQNHTKTYWTNRYLDNNTGWDIGYPSSPLKAYFDQLQDKNIKILIPGAGNAYEAAYLTEQGFKNVFVMDISPIPLENFKNRNPAFPDAQLVTADFFDHEGKYDMIVEQTFFCSFEPLPENRKRYVRQSADLLNEGGKLIGVWFDFPLESGNMTNRPFGGSKEEYIDYFFPYFKIKAFDRCFNSIGAREGNELFGIFIKK